MERRAAYSAQQFSITGDMAASLQRYATKLQELAEHYEGPPFLERPPELAGRRPVVLLAQPLKLDGKVRGWLTLYRAARLDRPARQWLCLFADVAALLLERTALLREKEKATQLQSVWKASKVLHSTLDLGELMELILELATLAVSAERGTVFLVDAQTRELWSIVAMGLKREEIRLPLGQGVAGHVAETGNILYIPDAYQSPLFDSSFDQKFGFRSRSILCLPIRNNRGEVLGVLELLNKKEGEFQPEDVEVLDPLTIHIALALENALRHREILARQRMEKELALARGIQRSLLPASPPLVPGYDIAALHESCFEVGGDYYDFLSLGPNTLLLVVADVEGKGVSSALIMSNLQASLRALVMNQHSLEVIVRS
ncbi:MAG: GAF domain-containing protein [Acidobacteria bacterium]|nr:GAF domain-containing protein [Acidobacteriota bacterium]